MTSVNTVEYLIRDSEGKHVGTHHQNIYCKTHWGDLLKYTPYENFTITHSGHDESEMYWEDEPINLKKFIDNLISHKAKFNTWEDLSW